MRQALPLFAVAALFFTAAHAVEPFPLRPAGANDGPQATTITRNDGGTRGVPVEHVIALDSNPSAKLGATLTRVQMHTSTVQACPGTALVGRRTVGVQNQGPYPLWCCLGSSCTPVAYAAWEVPALANGTPGQQTFDVGDAIPVRCIADTAVQVDGGSTLCLELR